MKINDDDIRAAFAWPVRYEEESGFVRDAYNDPILCMIGWDVLEHEQLGEAIAAMLNERFAPKAEDMCKCGYARDQHGENKECLHKYREGLH